MTTDANECVSSEPVVEQVAPTESLEPSAVEAIPEPLPKASTAVSESLGLRLRAAREAKGLTCEAAAATLRLPVSVVQAIETERFDRIGHAIYLRSYLTKYLRLLDLPLVLAERVLQEHTEQQPPLVTTGTVSRPRYLFERYSGSALYLILTGVIVVPAVLLAMRAGFDQNLVRVTPLETPELSVPAVKSPEQTAAPTATTGEAKVETVPAGPTEAAAVPAPLIASMTPFPPPAKDKPTSNVPAANVGEHEMRLSLAEASWVEIVAADGQKLEYGLLAAGSAHTYASAKSLDVRLGNANGATLVIDGKAVDIAPYRHSNVAHFKVADGEAAAVHTGG
jgi:cytoskeleton protein RodZ